MLYCTYNLLNMFRAFTVSSSWWWAYKCSKHVEQIISAIKHSVASSWFSSLRHLLYLLYFLDTQHVSGINISIFRSLRLCWWSTTLAVLFLDCCVLELGRGSSRAAGWSTSCASTGSPDTTLDEPRPNSNTQQSNNNTTNVVFQQYSRKLLKMEILMPETWWVSKK
jgi:hypothetical protein